MPKTEAQIRNEEEVRRIMEERGYSSISSKKKVKKAFSNNFPFKSFIVGFLVIGFLVSGGILLQNNPFGNEQRDSSIDEATSSKNNEELAKFQACLGAIDTSEIALDDVEFWNKHISRYEQTLSCYDNYPSVADPSEKTELQNQLAELQNNSKSAEANDATYRANMAQIDAELERNLAKIKEEGDTWDAELSKRVQERQTQSDERNAQYAKEQVMREQQTAALEAQRQQEQAAKKAKCDNYLATYGGSTPEELADNDRSVKTKYNEWQDWLRRAKEVEGVQFTYQQCQIIWSKGQTCPSQYAGKAQEAESEYYQLLQQKITYYRNLKNEACNY